MIWKSKDDYHAEIKESMSCIGNEWNGICIAVN